MAYTEFSSNCNFWDILFGNCPTVDVNFSSNDNSSFLLLDASGNTNSTLTLKSGSSFSTVGQEDVVLSFYHYFDNEYGQGHIEYKADGVSWRSLNSSLPFTSNVGSPGDFRYEEFTIPGNLENVRIRFRYEGGPRDRYWALNNIKVSGVGTAPPTITWTRSDDPNWGDEVEGKANLLPADIGPINQTTTFTATYTYEGIENGDNCNTGQNSVTVHVREPLKPQIVADYCYYEGVEGKENTIILSVEGVDNIVHYEWRGQGINDSDINDGDNNDSSIEVDLASTYFVTIEDSFGCTAEASLPISKNLVQNGTFEEGSSERDLSPSRTRPRFISEMNL